MRGCITPDIVTVIVCLILHLIVRNKKAKRCSWHGKVTTFSIWNGINGIRFFRQKHKSMEHIDSCVFSVPAFFFVGQGSSFAEEFMTVFVKKLRAESVRSACEQFEGLKREGFSWKNWGLKAWGVLVNNWKKNMISISVNESYWYIAIGCYAYRGNIRLDVWKAAGTCSTRRIIIIRRSRKCRSHTQTPSRDFRVVLEQPASFY